jgi:hypothetical protein
MAGEVYFEDNTLKVIDNTEDAIEAALLESSAEIVSATARNSRVDSGQTKNSWRSVVSKNSNGYEAVMGSDLENAIWEEFGTGEHAISGNGRKGKWRYKDKKGNWHTTTGKTPKRAFQNAYNSQKPKIAKHFQDKFGIAFK